MRWCYLYQRSRAVPAAVAAVAGICAALSAVALAADNDFLTVRFTALFAACGAAVTARTLCAPDPVLERTAAIRWPLRRTVHVAVAVAAVSGTLGVMQAAVGSEVAPWPLVRTGIGFIGLAALGAAALGPSLAWCAPLVWTFVAFPVREEPGAALVQVLAWPVHTDTTVAATMALVLGVGGTLAYAAAGPGDDPRG